MLAKLRFEARLMDAWLGMLPMAMAMCAVLGVLAVVMSDATVGLHPAAMLVPVLANVGVAYGASTRGRGRIWAVGLATAAGAGLGVWFLAASWTKARHPGPYSPVLETWLVLVGLLVGLVVAGVLAARRKARAK